MEPKANSSPPEAEGQGKPTVDEKDLSVQVSLPDGSSSVMVPGVAYRDGDIPGWLWRAGRGSWALIGMAVVVVGIVAATAQITPVFIAVFAALVFTSVLNPVVNRLNKHMSRGLAVLLTLVGSIALFSGMLGFVVTSVAGQWGKLGKELTQGFDQIAVFLDRLPFQLSLTSDDIYVWVTHRVQDGLDYAADNWQQLAGKVLSNAGGIFIFFTILALGVFVTIFFLLSGSEMWRWFLNLLPTDKRAVWNHGAQAGWRTFAGYARGTMIIAVTDGVMAWVFLALMRVPLASALGVLVMIGALIPMIGAPAAMVLAMIVALATKGVVAAIIVGLGIALIGQIEGHILQPLIMGKQVALSPVVVILGVASGTLVAGLLGAIIAIPIIAVTWSVFSALYHRDPPIEGPLPEPPGDGEDEDESGPEIPKFVAKVIEKTTEVTGNSEPEKPTN